MKMNSTDDPYTYMDEAYDYDYNASCDLDTGSDLLERAVVQPVLYMLFCLGLLGNSTVIWVLLRYMKLRTMTDVCLLNLALSDLMLASSLPLWSYNAHNLTLCKLMTGVYQLGFYSGTFFVTLMSMDRYLAIVHAVAAMRARTLRYGIIASVTIWAISVILALPQVVFASLVTDSGGNSSKCQPYYPEDDQQFWKKLRNFSENTVGLFVCLPIIIFCYVTILVVLSKSRNSNKDKAVKMIFTIVCVFVVCWVPYNIIVFLQTLQMVEILRTCKVLQDIYSATNIAEIIALSHCCINPIIYAFIGEKFRKSLCRVLARYPCLSQQTRLISLRDTDKETSNTPIRTDY